MSRIRNGGKGLDTETTLRALRRAARRARELGEKTHTPVYVIQHNRIVDLTKKNGVTGGRSSKRRATP